MRAWRDAPLEGRAVCEGWPEWINVPSKVGQVAAVRVVARERRAADALDGTLVAAICPGLIDTEASRPWFDHMDEAQTPRERRWRHFASPSMALWIGPLRASSCSSARSSRGAEAPTHHR